VKLFPVEKRKTKKKTKKNKKAIQPKPKNNSQTPFFCRDSFMLSAESLTDVGTEICDESFNDQKKEKEIQKTTRCQVRFNFRQ